MVGETGKLQESYYGIASGIVRDATGIDRLLIECTGGLHVMRGGGGAEECTPVAS
jgi:hypothetical protein